jgi:predicted DNA-binding protein with PD1-like motif
MHSKEKDNIIVIRLFQDEDLIKKLKEVCKKHHVKNAILISGLGQLSKFKLGFFNENRFYDIEKFDEPHELLSLSGNICQQNDDYEFHIHAVLSNEKKNAIGGHLIEGKVEVTNEIVLLKTHVEFIRKVEEKTGLKGMFLE